MKKIISSIFLLIFSLCLVGCNKVRSEEDKIMFDEYFSNIDSIVNYKKVEYYLTFNNNNQKYKYSCEYKEDGAIEIWNIISDENIYHIYRYIDNKLIIEEYDTWPNDSIARILKVSEINITKEEFLEQYEIIKNPKYNLDLEQSNYYRVKVRNMHEDNWEHKFEFNKDYVYEIKLFDFSLKLSNCNMTFTTYEFEKNLERISYIQINGTYNDTLYNLYITIDK
jgi:hypothetical protein